MHRIITAVGLSIAMLFGGGALAQQAGTDLLGAPPEDGASIGSQTLARLLVQVSKPGNKPGASPVGGDDSCRWANDRECDEPGFGTGACEAGTDYSDCWRIMAGQDDDSCQWARDGECDEPGLGTGACTQGTDLTDCGDMSELRFRNDTCDTAFNNVCDEPGTGTGRCEARSDRADCVGRERPMTIQDHFFGNDDRVLMDTSQFPWRSVGYVTFDSGGTCTATLIGPDILITASHCVHDDGRLNPSGEFHTGDNMPGGARTARVIDHMIDPAWDDERFSNTDEIDGTDWALLRIDQSLGDELGFVGVRALVRDGGQRNATRARIWQGGYSWDTGDHLSGNLDCRITTVYNDNTMSHNCDTTRGDSGSPFMIQDGGQWYVVATDSNFRAIEGEPFEYIAVRSESWVDYVEDFTAGRIGAGGLRPRGPGVKPGAHLPGKPGM